ncbi:rossmann fold nucleotide-binding protein Smf possibly [Algibacter lectus]|uniref:Rossmann fold nucleotide-binding protein Smf possibly n=1 Tax=Algibacter lectus TaxID=221126 RepID=A0A090X4V6_9FLAO|nr:rossmann fold nucleotide-binding protein Smf possibly [Algibacter lectus]
MTENDLLYALALQHVPNIGDITAKRLISHCGSAEAVLKEKRTNLLKIDGVGQVILEGLAKPHHLKEAEKEMRFIEENNIKVSYFENIDYPEKLKHCIDGPILLFQSGNIDLKKQHLISIVGARKITTNGIAFCEKLVETLKPYNPVIISGFAYGTDITAHKAAIKHGLQTWHVWHMVWIKFIQKYIKSIW